MKCTTFVLALALVAVVVHAKPLEVLETSYKILKQPQHSLHEAFQERRALADHKPFEILEQTFRFFPRRLAIQGPSSNLPTSMSEDTKTKQAKDSGLTSVKSTSSPTTQYTATSTGIHGNKQQSDDPNIGHGTVIPLQMLNSGGFGEETRVLVDSNTWNDIRENTEQISDFNDTGKILPSPMNGNTALETLAGAGAVALMAYGMSYALPLAAPLITRRSGTSNGNIPRNGSPASRFVNWLEDRNGVKKRSRIGGDHQLRGNSPGKPYESYVDVSGQVYDDYEDRNDAPFRDDFENGSGPLSNPFDGVPYEESNTYTQRVSPDFGSVVLHPSINNVRLGSSERDNSGGTDHYSFGFDPKNRIFGDDPTIESGPSFGKITYEYDFSNTYLAPSVIEIKTTTLEPAQKDAKKEELPKKQVHNTRAPHPQPALPKRKRPAKKPKGSRPSSSNIFTDFWKAFHSRIPNHIAARQRNKNNKRKPMAVSLKQPRPGAKRPSRPQSHGRPSKERRHKRPRRPQQVRYHKARPKMDDASETYYADDRAIQSYPNYVSLEQLNRLADEDMHGVIKELRQHPHHRTREQYDYYYDDQVLGESGPRALSLKTQIGYEEEDLYGSGSNMYIMDQDDLAAARSRNTDSTDYIYAKPNTVGRTFSPDYTDFDYVDIRGSSSDVDRTPYPLQEQQQKRYYRREEQRQQQQHQQQQHQKQQQQQQQQNEYRAMYHYQQKKQEQTPKTMQQQLKATTPSFKGIDVVTSKSSITPRYSQQILNSQSENRYYNRKNINGDDNSERIVKPIQPEEGFVPSVRSYRLDSTNAQQSQSQVNSYAKPTFDRRELNSHREHW